MVTSSLMGLTGSVAETSSVEHEDIAVTLPLPWSPLEVVFVVLVEVVEELDVVELVLAVLVEVVELVLVEDGESVETTPAE
ncbi:uncharacterized protein IUM83_11576 [Phytophthora cinnamomi]|uniref:uncharacterized protein n=1 Tax=Phytophthora cinnamomi TaxID=4785 RepID=UPI003559B754|nr:hypothetical protein IUM83_11576 [Phytophthora cinnamomi]